MRAIDADAFKAYMKDALEQTRNAYTDGGEWAQTITEQFCKDIDEQPTIEPRKKGKWICLDKDERFFHPHIVKCSVCNNTLDMYGVNAGRGDANFCPNCGADMRGKQDDEP